MDNCLYSLRRFVFEKSLSRDARPQVISLYIVTLLVVAGVYIFHVMSSLCEAQPKESQKGKAALYIHACS